MKNVMMLFILGLGLAGCENQNVKTHEHTTIEEQQEREIERRNDTSQAVNHANRSAHEAARNAQDAARSARDAAQSARDSLRNP